MKTDQRTLNPFDEVRSKKLYVDDTRQPIFRPISRDEARFKRLYVDDSRQYICRIELSTVVNDNPVARNVETIINR